MIDGVADALQGDPQRQMAGHVVEFEEFVVLEYQDGALFREFLAPHLLPQ